MSYDPINNSKTKPNYFLIAVFILALIGLFFPKSSSFKGDNFESTLVRINNKQTIKIGYEGYPPYTIENPNTGKLTGYSVDIAEYIAKEAGWKIEWVKTNPETKITDIQTDKFDLMVEPIFQTIPRAKNVSFTKPYSYFGYAVGIVRKGDIRFKTIEDLNKKGVRVAVRLGYTDQTFAEQNLPLAEIRALKADDINQVFQDVVAGNSDIALADLEQVKAFFLAHPDIVDTLFTKNPPALVAAGFMLKQGDFTFYNFLNASLDYLQSNGVLDNLDKKYKVTAFREKNDLISNGN